MVTCFALLCSLPFPSSFQYKFLKKKTVSLLFQFHCLAPCCMHNWNLLIYEPFTKS